MVGHNLPPLIEIGLTISENLGQAAALPSLPLITPLLFDGRLHSGPDPMGEFNEYFLRLENNVLNDFSFSDNPSSFKKF